MTIESICQASQDGLPCIHAATLHDPVRLCDEHKLQVASAVMPALLASALRDARSVSSRTLRADLAHLVASAQAAPMPTTDPHGALVYFMANGGRVKIGYTKSLFNRISALSLREDAVLLLLHGGKDLERALHAKFGAHRIADSEWFELAPDVVHFIAGKAPKHRAGSTPRPTRAKTARSRSRSGAGPKGAVTRRNPKAEMQALLDLIWSRGSAEEVTILDARAATELPRSTAAKRLAKAKALYAAGQRTASETDAEPEPAAAGNHH